MSDVSLNDDPPIETLAIPKTEIIPGFSILYLIDYVVIEPEEGRVVLVRSAKVASNANDNATVSTDSSTSESTVPATEVCQFIDIYLFGRVQRKKMSMPFLLQMTIAKAS